MFSFFFHNIFGLSKSKRFQSTILRLERLFVFDEFNFQLNINGKYVNLYIKWWDAGAGAISKIGALFNFIIK